MLINISFFCLHTLVPILAGLYELGICKISRTGFANNCSAVVLVCVSHWMNDYNCKCLSKNHSGVGRSAIVTNPWNHVSLESFLVQSGGTDVEFADTKSSQQRQTKYSPNVWMAGTKCSYSSVSNTYNSAICSRFAPH